MPSLLSSIRFVPPSLALPTRLIGLERLAYNLYWTWQPDVVSLWKRLDARAYATEKNPVALLQKRHDWSEFLDNPGFLADYDTILQRFDQYQSEELTRMPGTVAYFCAEFGLHDHLPIYSGGLGVLAGDHVKTASDMGVPLVGVGLLYRQGYFRQAIDADGKQEHGYPAIDVDKMALLRVRDPASGLPLQVQVELPGRNVHAAVWLCAVGRVPLLLLDTDVADNHAGDRAITAQLYVRGREMRLHQELILGVGGVRALQRLGVQPSVWHLNEGHSAFMLLERLRQKVGGVHDSHARLGRQREV
jgi:glycogen phosphorylase